MKHAVIITALFVGILGAAQAQDAPVDAPRSEAGDARDEYTVKRGDTLWDISEHFLDDPFRWPEIWKKNPFIADPHWIYPGQMLTLNENLELKITEIQQSAPPVVPETMPQPRIEFGSDPRSEQDNVAPDIAVVEPAGRGTDDGRRVLRKLAAPRPVFTPESFMRTGFIALRSELPTHHIVSLENNTNATRFDYVLIDMGSRDVRVGDLLSVGHVGDTVRHPETGEDLGVVIRIKGYIRVESVGDNQARCQISESYDPIQEHDLVLPARVKGSAEFDAYVAPDVDIAGTILAVNEPMLSIHTHDIIYFDKGWMDGVRPGDRFAIFNRDKTSDGSAGGDPVGEIEALNVLDDHTAALVVSVTDKAISIGDRVSLTARVRLTE